MLTTITMHIRLILNSNATGPLQWWEHVSLAGIGSYTAAISALYMGIDVNPLLLAVAVHLFLDFAVQSDDTAAKKDTGDFRTVLYHSFITGGFPGLILGGIPGLLVSFLYHMAIDMTPKFGLKGWYGIIADQLAHIATLVGVVYLCS